MQVTKIIDGVSCRATGRRRWNGIGSALLSGLKDRRQRTRTSDWRIIRVGLTRLMSCLSVIEPSNLVLLCVICATHVWGKIGLCARDTDGYRPGCDVNRTALVRIIGMVAAVIVDGPMLRIRRGRCAVVANRWFSFGNRVH